MYNSINDIFESFRNECRVNGTQNEALHTIQAGRSCLEEFITVCDECVVEYNNRIPAVMVNCR